MTFNLYNNKIRRASIILFFMMAITKLLGLVRELVIANYFGASKELDIFLISFTFPSAVLSILVYSIPSWIIPKLTKIKSQYGIMQFWGSASFLLNCSFLFTLLISLILFFNAHALIHFLSPTLSQVDFDNSIILLRILLIFLIFGGVFPILKGILHINNTFLLPGLASLSINFILIVSILLFVNKCGNQILAFGFSCGAVIQFFILYIYLFRKGLKVNCQISNKYINVINLSFGIILLIEIGGQFFTIIDRYYASQIEGIISALNYSMVIFMIPISLIGLAIGNAIFPNLSQYAADHKWAEFKVLIKQSTMLVIYIGIPVFLIFLLWPKVIVSIIFERGAFPHYATTITAEILKYYSYGLIAVLMHTILTKAYYSLGLEKILFFVSVSSIILKIGLSEILFKSLAYNGLALATSITFIFSAMILYIYLGWYLKRY